MTRMTVHVTEVALTRTPITSFPANGVSIRVLRGYGLALSLYESTLPMALATVIYRDINPTRQMAVKRPMAQLAYTLSRRPDVSEPFDVEISYDDGGTDSVADES